MPNTMAFAQLRIRRLFSELIIPVLLLLLRSLIFLRLDESASTSATEELEEFLDLEEELDRDRPDPLRELDLLDDTPCII